MSNPQKAALSEFEELVQADIRNEASDEESQELRDPENAQEWHDEILGIIRRIDVQLSNSHAERLKLRRDYDDAVARKLEWRASALGFRALAEKRLAEAKELLRQGEIEIIKLGQYEEAIRIHHEAVRGDQPAAAAEQADQQLWSTVGL